MPSIEFARDEAGRDHSEIHQYDPDCDTLDQCLFVTAQLAPALSKSSIHLHVHAREQRLPQHFAQIIPITQLGMQCLLHRDQNAISVIFLVCPQLHWMVTLLYHIAFVKLVALHESVPSLEKNSAISKTC